MRKAHKLIHEVSAASRDIEVTDRSLIWNSDLIETLEFDNLIAQAVVTMDSARQPHRKPRRACARGLSRARRQELDEAHAGLARCATGKVTIDYRPVHTYTLTNDVAYIEPKAGCTEARTDTDMVEFTLPKNSKVTEGKTWP